MENFTDKAKEFLSHVAVDYVSLGNLVQIFFDFQITHPNKSEFSSVLDFLLFLTRAYPIKVLQGVNMLRVNEPTEKIITWLRTQFEEGKYDDINFSIWFDMDEQDIPSEYRLDKAPPLPATRYPEFVTQDTTP